MFNAIRHLLYSSDSIQLIICIIYFIYFMILVNIYRKINNDDRKMKIWNLLCFVPFIISIIHFFIYVFGEALSHLILSYILIYIISLLIMLLPLLVKKKIIYKISIIFITIICLISFVFYIDSEIQVNYTNKSLTDSYISLCDYFEKNYIMNDWKKIDYNKLKNDGLVLVEEAEQTGDINKYYEALENFVNEHHDGHMGLSFYNNYNYLLNEIKSFNDYGLSLLTLDDGTTIAVDVEDNLEIKSGDVITKWNGQPIDEAIEKVKAAIDEPLLENEKIVKTFFLSGVGSDTVDITYINSSNNEITITLNKLDSDLPRALKSYSTFNHTHDDKLYDYKMLDENIGYLKIGMEETNLLADYIGYLTGNHKVAREEFRKSLQELRENGMTKLVIDVRNNGGGYDEVATALASLFSKEKMYAFSLGYRLNNKNKSLVDHYVLSDGEFSDVEVLVLTNMRCGSACDGMILYLSRIENITVAGLTNPGGFNQETGGYIYMPKGVVINYPIGFVLDNDGNPNIDIDNTRISRDAVDIKIPLDKEGALKLFNNEDYELEWAIDYLNR